MRPVNIKLSKYKRAIKITSEELSRGSSRKDILFRLTEELDTTWNTAITFYYKAKKEIKEKEEKIG